MIGKGVYNPCSFIYMLRRNEKDSNMCDQNVLSGRRAADVLCHSMKPSWRCVAEEGLLASLRSMSRMILQPRVLVSSLVSLLIHVKAYTFCWISGLSSFSPPYCTG